MSWRTIALLVANIGVVVVLSFLGSIYLSGSSQERRLTEVRLVGLQMALREYRADTGTFPNNLKAVAQHDYSSELPLSHPKMTQDGWGWEIHYLATDASCILFSLGRDGLPAGRRDRADIVYPCEHGALRSGLPSSTTRAAPQ